MAVLLFNSEPQASGVQLSTDLLTASTVRIQASMQNLHADFYSFNSSIHEEIGSSEPTGPIRNSLVESARLTRGDVLTYKSKNSRQEVQKKVLHPFDLENQIKIQRYKALIIPEFLAPLGDVARDSEYRSQCISLVNGLH